MTRAKEPKMPAFMFYPGDWKKDPNLSKCSPATRGIWIDLICAMHDGGRTGTLTGTVAELAQICRCTRAEMRHALAELGRAKTANVTFSDGRLQKCTVINRRMLREAKSRESARIRTRVWREKRRGNSSGDENEISPLHVHVHGHVHVQEAGFGSEDLSKRKKNRERERGSASDSVTAKSREDKAVADAPSLSPFFSSISEKQIKEFQASELYAHLDVNFIYRKMLVWCEANDKQPTKHRLLGWLNSEKANERATRNDDRGTPDQEKRVARSLGSDN
jgi:hypothetical protein